MSELDPFFKFKIGDFVCHRGVKLYKESYEDPYRHEEPSIGIINSRQIEECPGGIQIHYHIRFCTTGFTEKSFDLLEHEIEKFIPAVKEVK